MITDKKDSRYLYSIDGKSLEIIMKDNGFTYERTAKMAKLNGPYLCASIHKGTMNIRTIAKVCNLFGIEPESFVNEEVDDEMMWKWS